MDELVAQTERVRLKRRILWDDHAEDSRYVWRVRWAVEGMAGAVALAIYMGAHGHAHGKEHERWDPVGFTVARSTPRFVLAYVPGGVTVHAYRPMANANGPEECNLLHGGRCWLLERDWPSLGESEALVARFSQPDGVEATWQSLERIYAIEFVPADPPAVIAARERELGAQLAQARLEGPPVPPPACNAHYGASIRCECAEGHKGPHHSHSAKTSWPQQVEEPGLPAQTCEAHHPEHGYPCELPAGHGGAHRLGPAVWGT